MEGWIWWRWGGGINRVRLRRCLMMGARGGGRLEGWGEEEEGMMIA